MVHYLVAAVSLGSGLFGVLAVASGGGGVRALSLGPCVWPAVIRGVFGPGAGFRVG